MSLTSQFFQVNGQNIHAKVGGPQGAPVMIMLHGFPEYWAAWADVAEHLLADYRVVLPDQRGFYMSSKPQGVKAYETKHMVNDLIELVDAVAPNQKIILCGHDWGASVAYAFAMRHADRVSKLIIANGVHPMCFQKGLLAGGAQTDASQYMNVLRAEGSETRLSADNFEKLLSMFHKFSSAPWLTEEIKNQYRAAWSYENALPTMLNWYRGSPMVVPKSGTAPKPFELTQAMFDRYRISMPHLLIWGVDDTALLDASREDLVSFCDDLTVVEKQKASHWILHEHPEFVAKTMKAFLK